MRFNARMAPIKVAVMPLVKKEALEGPARKLFQDLQKDYKAEFDVAGSIGKRYRRQDEIGTPYCLTYDFDTLEDQAVTIRDRDSMTQERISLDKVKDWLKDHLAL